METTILAIIAFCGMFTFAFGMAWILPLFTAHANITKDRSDTDIVFPLLDVLLMTMDCIPLFWLVRIKPLSCEWREAARQVWSEEPSVRNCFYGFLVSVSLIIVLVMALTLIN